MSRYIDADALKANIDKSIFDADDKEWYLTLLANAPSIDIVICKECKRGKPYSDKQLECDALGLGGLKFPNDFCSYGEPNSSEKPNNCEHITEDGVTCAKYPACDDCLDNPLNKVKGSERLVKGSEQTDCLDRYDRKTEPQTCRNCKWSQTVCRLGDNPPCHSYEPKDEPQTDCAWKKGE